FQLYALSFQLSLCDALDAVADLESRAGHRRRDGRHVVDIRDFHDAHRGRELADDLSCRRILDFPRDALDVQLIADFHAGLAADVEDDLAAFSRGDETF